MSRTDQPAAVAAYLRQLDAALAELPPTTAAEIRDGIAEELASLGPEDAEIRMTQLGDPTFIAAEARAELAPDRADHTATATSSKPPALASRGYIIFASLAVALGAVIPFLGWLIGYVLVGVSPAWRRWEKVVMILVPLGVTLLTAGWFAVIEVQRRAASVLPSDQPLLPVTPVVLGNAAIALLIANVAVGVWLLIRALRRA